MESLLFGVDSHDPATYGGTVLILLGVAIFASLLPAARAARTRGTGVLRVDGFGGR